MSCRPRDVMDVPLNEKLRKRQLLKDIAARQRVGELSTLLERALRYLLPVLRQHGNEKNLNIGQVGDARTRASHVFSANMEDGLYRWR